MPNTPASQDLIDSPYARRRLILAVVLGLFGCSCMYVVSVVLPSVQAEFQISRSMASLPYTALMIGFGVGGMLMGRLADKHGVRLPLAIGGIALFLGFGLASMADNIYSFALAHGLLLGLLGAASAFSPLLADTALWWNKRRGIAVAICASGNYLAGAVWPAVTQQMIDHIGWRNAYLTLGIVCASVVLILSRWLKQRPPVMQTTATPAQQASAALPFGLSLNRAQLLLCLAGLACCVAMSMPQVHIVAYCADLGYGAARGAEMLSIMLGCGIISRLVSGAICDRIGGLRTLLMGSTLQGIALLMFLPFNDLVSLYLISALFGLFQGGIVPSYAIIIREYFPAEGTGQRTGAVMMATLFGMALGGWMSGKLFDITGSYKSAMLNGLVWNAMNLSIAIWLLWRVKNLGLSIKPLIGSKTVQT